MYGKGGDGKTDHHGTHSLSYTSDFELKPSVFLPDSFKIEYRAVQATS
jgi:hypothetical protein